MFVIDKNLIYQKIVSTHLKFFLSNIKDMNKFETIFRFFFSLCLSLCLYQISDISKIYFSYKTTTFVSYSNQSEISLPAITICTDKQNLLKPEYLSKINKTQNNTKNETQIKEFLNNMTVREQFNALYDFSQVFNLCAVFKTIGVSHNYYLKSSEGSSYEPYVDCDSFVPIRRSIDYTR